MKRTLLLLAGLLLCVPSTMSGAFRNILQIYAGSPRPRAEVAIVAHGGNLFRGISVGVNRSQAPVAVPMHSSPVSR